MTMLIRMTHARKVSANGYEVIAAKKGCVYQVPDALGRVLVGSQDAVAVEAHTLREALPRSHVLAGRPAAPTS